MDIQDLEIVVDDSRVKTKLYLPHGTMSKLVIFCHGFPGTNRLPGLAPALIEHNVGLAEVGYRGDAGCEGKFSFFGSGFDVNESYDALREIYPETPMELLGYSAGGFYSQYFFTVWHPRLERIVLLNSVIYLGVLGILGDDLWNEAAQILSLNERSFYSSELMNLRKWEATLAYHVNNINVPVDMVHSKNDEIIPYGSAKQFFKENDCTRNFVTIPNKGHILDGNEPELLSVLI